MNHRPSLMTLEEKEKRAEVPEQIEPRLVDGTRHTNGLYTLSRREGVLPKSIVVIPDTNSLYIGENDNVFDLYEVGGLREGEASLPFVYRVELSGPKGEIVRFRSVFDDGALVNAIDETVYLTLKGRLTALTPSKKILRMADGRRVPSIGLWKGRVTVEGVHREGTFEVFNSNGAWAMLFGKPLLRAFNAVHDYMEDSICIPRGERTDLTEWAVLTNQFTSTQGIAGKLLANLTVDIKQLIRIPQAATTLNRHITESTRQCDTEIAERKIEDQNTYKLRGGITTPHEGSPATQPHPDIVLHSPDVISSPGSNDEEVDENLTSTWLLNEAARISPDHPGTEQPDVTKVFEPSVLTWKTDPHSPERVAAIQAEVTIGPDLTPDQTEEVRQMIAEYADCFALSMSEVLPVEGAAHRLDIPRDTQFRTKVNQRPQTPPQKEFFNGVLDKMLEAGIIRPIDHQDVKCCGATTLAKKAHEGSGRTLDMLKHQVNDQCIAAGFPPAHQNLPPTRI